MRLFIISILLVLYVNADTYVVDSDASCHWKNGCKKTCLSSSGGYSLNNEDNIQDAVDRASAGDTIQICPGTYNEAVQITNNKNNLILESTTGNPDDVIIDTTSLSGNNHAFYINNSTSVKFHNLTIKAKLNVINFSNNPGTFEVTNSKLSSTEDHIIYIADNPSNFKIINNEFTQAGDNYKSAIQFQSGANGGEIKDNNISTNNANGYGIYISQMPNNLTVTNNCFLTIPNEEAYSHATGSNPLEWNGNYWQDYNVYGVVDNSRLGSCGQSCNSYAGILDPLEFEGKIFSILDTYSVKEFTKVTFENTFSSPPAVFILPSTNGNNPANIRIKNVTRYGFEAAMAEPVGEDGAHVAMSVNYFAINNGVHKIGNSIIEVGSLATKKVKPLAGINQNEDYGWESLSTRANFCDPAIVSTIQTLNNEPNYVVDKPSKPFIVPAIEIEGNDINISLDKVPTSSNTEVNVDETISYIIAEANIQDNFVDSNDKIISFETIKSDAIIPGWGSKNNPVSVVVNFLNTYSTTPLVSASKTSNNEEEPGWLRRETLNKTSISLTVDESRDDKLWGAAKNERNHANEKATIFAFSGEFYIFTGICQYVKSKYKTSVDGYYYVDEGTASIFGLKPFEIYCKNMNSDGAIAYLPTVINEHSSNNSNFKFTTLNNDNYYDSTNVKEYFDKIRIDNYFFAHDDFLNSGFSNLNLIGTPFKVDMTNTTLATCDAAIATDKLRIGHFSQAIKIDPKVDNASYCTSTQMKFTQIDSYYAKDAYENMTTCAQIAQNSTTQPPSGYYLLKKPKQVSGESSHIVAYCDMNPPVNNQIWTMFLALGAETTIQKQDITSQSDTCSKVGYSFFAPNSKEVMYSARNFLFSGKSEWEDYTGTVREYFSDNSIGGWATDNQASYLKPNPIPDGAMWPYGPMGIYKPSGGASNSGKKMPMSIDFLSDIDKTDGFGSLDETGWKSVLPEIDSTYGDTWWIADISTGYQRNTSTGHLELMQNLVEPNGDYDSNNWLGWFADANGFIVHYNDQNGNNKYRYSNYICMSKDMYVDVDIEWDTWGFDAWDTNKSIAQRDITTKIASQDFDLTIASLTETNDGLQDFNGTVCVKIVDDQNISYNGDGTKVHFSGTKTQNTIIPINITSAVKDARVYLSWREQVDEACPLYVSDGVTLATDNFAIRPKTFSLTLPASSFAGENFSLDIKALDNADNPTSKYNETKDISFEITSAISKSGCIDGILDIASFSFLNGYNSIDTNYSDVGDINITIKERLDNEFALVDKDDTNDEDRLITPYTANMTIKPYELNVTSVEYNTTTGQSWLYMADVNDMSQKVKATIVANDKQHNLVQNFTDACYAKDVNIITNFAVINTNSGVNIKYDDNVTNSIDDINKTITIPSTSFTTSKADLDYDFNIERDYKTPYNPIMIGLRQINITSNNVAKEENNATVNLNTDFYYGRVKTEDLKTNEKSTPHSLHVEVYDSSGTLGFKQNSLNWYENEKDDYTNTIIYQEKDNFTFGNPKGGVTVNSIQNIAKGNIDFTITNSWTNSDSSMIHLDIPIWLWYSKYNNYDSTIDCSYHPCFEYSYINPEGTSSIQSGTFKGSSIGNDYNATKQKVGVKTFR